MFVNWLASLASVGVMLSGLAGCAVAWTDTAGAQHVLGFANISVRPATGERLAGDIVEVSTIGLSLLSNDRTASFALGYNRTTTAAFLDNSLARGPFDRLIDPGDVGARNDGGK